MRKNKHTPIAARILSAALCAVLVLLLVPAAALVGSADTETNNIPIIVSLGDSFSSGEGIPPFYGQYESVPDKVRDYDWLAHRSMKSWSGRLTLPNVHGGMASHRGTNWYFVAASGAETKHMNGTFKKSYEKDYRDASNKKKTVSGSYNLPAQLSVFNEVPYGEVDYVTMTLGGNDAGFVDVITEAAVPHPFNPSALSDKINAIWKEFYKSGGIRDDLLSTYRLVAERAGPQAKIIVAGYPKLLSEKGSGFLFSKSDAATINQAVTQFNDEIEKIVNQCKAEGIKICFVSVEEEFEGHGAYSDDPYLNSVTIGAQSEELKDSEMISAYSIHPNDGGAAAYARCVQRKINAIEADGGRSEWPEMGGSTERDVVLVLDSSGSMDGEPMRETIEASQKFVTEVLKEEASIGIVEYNSYGSTLQGLCKQEEKLKSTLGSIYANGNTNIEDGLRCAETMLNGSVAKKKIIVLMSDGMPNNGLLGEELIAYAQQLKDKGIYIYTLGFFGDLSDKTEPQALMEAIASEGCHYEVDSAENIVYFFKDMADHIQGVQYIYIRIACPVDVTVRYNGEKLTSKGNTTSQRTEFGTLTFEENSEVTDDSKDNRIKVLRLKDGVEYDIDIRGNGRGRMDYTIGFMDESGEYSDLREFNNIKITKDTEIATVAGKRDTTVLHVDEDGDGRIDLRYEAAENAIGKQVERADWALIFWIAAAVLTVGSLAVFAVMWYKDYARCRKQSPAAPAEQAAPVQPVAPVKQAVPTAPVQPSAPAPAAAPAPDYCFCTRCGSKQKKGASFCTKCGNPLKKQN